MPYITFLLLLVLGCQNFIAMQKAPEQPHGLGYKVIGGAAAVVAAEALSYSYKYMQTSNRLYPENARDSLPSDMYSLKSLACCLLCVASTATAAHCCCKSGTVNEKNRLASKRR